MNTTYTHERIAMALDAIATPEQLDRFYFHVDVAALRNDNDVREQFACVMAAIRNTYFYCNECDIRCEETCRSCGSDADVIECCGACLEMLDNCNCEAK